MRCPGLGDLDAAVRVLLARPEAEWASLAQTLIEEAHLSDKIRKRLRRIRPGHGSGSLSAEAMRQARATPGPALCDRRYCGAMGVVLQALEAWRRDPIRGCS